MKILTNIVCACALIGLLAACGSTTADGTTSTTARKEKLLAQAGFKVIDVKTPQQQAAVAKLPVGHCSAVTYKGKVVYVFPTGTKNQIYAGGQAKYNAYKKMVNAERAKAAPAPATGPAQGSTSASAQQTQNQQQMAGYADMSEETAGPNHIMVREYDGFGPMTDPW